MNTDLQFTGQIILDFQRPCVYVWRRDSHVLYIGCSRNGLARAIGKHHIIGVVDFVQANDVFDIYWTDRIGGLEAQLIEELKPLYNKGRGNRDKTRFNIE